MAERAAVADTHALVFHSTEGRKLGAHASAVFAACELRTATIYVPAAVVWEICSLTRTRRISLDRTPRVFFEDLFSNPSYQPVPLGHQHVLDAADLTFTRDPFDALICATARDLDLPLITRDTAIAASGAVRVIW